MDNLIPLWEKILNNLRKPSTKALLWQVALKEQIKLTKLDFETQTAVIYVSNERWIKLVKAKTEDIKQAIFDTLGVDFEVTITSENITPIEDNSTEEKLLEKIQLTRQTLAPNQSLIGRGWLGLINPQKD